MSVTLIYFYLFGTSHGEDDWSGKRQHQVSTQGCSILKNPVECNIHEDCSWVRGKCKEDYTTCFSVMSVEACNNRKDCEWSEGREVYSQYWIGWETTSGRCNSLDYIPSGGGVNFFGHVR